MAAGRNIFVQTLITYLLCFLMSVLFFMVALPLTLLPASMRYQNRLFYWLASRWSACCLFVAGLHVTVSGKELIPQQPAIFVMNHASALDILLVEQCLQGAPRLWLSKDEYRRTPLLNWVLYRMHVMVDGSSPVKAATALKTLQSKAGKNRMHVLLFPEGGRFDDGKIHPFFKGFSILSTLLNQPVVPVYLENAHKVYPKNSVLLHNAAHLSVVIGHAMMRASGESHDQFTARVRDWFIMQSNNSH